MDDIYITNAKNIDGKKVNFYLKLPIEKDFKRGILREGHVTDENLSFDFDEKDPYFFVGQYKKEKDGKDKGQNFILIKGLNLNENMIMEKE